MTRTDIPTIYYFDLAGRGEPLKVALVLAGRQYEHRVIGFGDCKALEEFPFGQAPRYTDDSVDMVQSNAILRHIGRKYELYGEGLENQARVDELIDGVEDVAVKYIKPVFLEKTEESRAEFWAKHGDPSSKQGKVGGAHLAFIDAILKRNSGEYAVGDSPTIADAAVFWLVRVMKRVWTEQLQSTYPDLLLYFNKLAQLPQIKEYLAASTET